MNTRQKLNDGHLWVYRVKLEADGWILFRIVTTINFHCISFVLRHVFNDARHVLYTGQERKLRSKNVDGFRRSAQSSRRV